MARATQILSSRLIRASAIAGMVVAGCSALSSIAPAAAGAASVSSCRFPNPQYKHVIYVQFDNFHLRRDNPNVPSDLQQIPALRQFLANKGSLLSNDHTVLISHTAAGITSTLTGLYPDRMGINVSNSYQYFTGSPTSTNFSSAFKARRLDRASFAGAALDANRAMKLIDRSKVLIGQIEALASDGVPPSTPACQA